MGRRQLRPIGYLGITAWAVGGFLAFSSGSLAGWAVGAALVLGGLGLAYLGSTKIQD